MGWKIVEIENAQRLRLFLDNLIIFNNDDKITIPINDIDTLLIDNVQINLSIQLINKLSEYNVNVIICDDKHLPHTQLLPISGNYNSLKILNTQIEWNHTFKSNLWSNIIRQKITNQIKILKIFNCINDEYEIRVFEINCPEMGKIWDNDIDHHRSHW